MARNVPGACPLDCPDTCSWIATVEGDRVIGIAANREHPYTRGALCSKTKNYLKYTKLLNVVVTLGAEDRTFIAERTLGWEPLRQRILQFPPERVAEICGVPQNRIVELGQRLATTRPAGIRAGMGLQRHGGGGMALRMLTAIGGG